MHYSNCRASRSEAIALVLAAVAAWKHGPGWWARRQAALAAEQRRHAAIAARADQQHQWVLAGDPRGTYGDRR